MAKKFSWKSLIFGGVIGVIALILVLRQVDFDHVLEILAQLDGQMLIVPLFIALGFQFLRPWRWQRIFPPHRRPGFWSCYAIFAIGNMANNFLPGRGGDLLRCFLGKQEHFLAGASLTLATIGLEKVLDGVVLLFIMLCSFVFFSPPQWLGQFVLLASLIFATAFLVLLVLKYRTEWFLVQIRSLFRTLHLDRLGEKLAMLFIQFAEGLSAVGSFGQMVELVLLTLLVWSGEAAIIWSLALALHISLSLHVAIIVVTILNLGLMIPAAPGYIGTYEFFSVAALKLFGIAPEKALALTLVMHTWAFSINTIRGIICLSISGIRFSQLFGK